ncbi:hypothetical protein BHE74_00012084 [Ensete ventricosum]|nr:hypothetical protein BHE74_00012084 [Ensete ventricosum]
MQYFQISGDFHDFPQDWTMMLKDFLDDDLRSMAQDREKIEPLQWRNHSKRRIIYRTQRSIPLTIKKDAPPWPSGTIALTTRMSSTPNHGQMFIIGSNTSRVGIGVTLMQDDPLTRSRLQLILQVSHLKWKFKEDDSAQILLIDTQDDEAKIQLMITWDHRIVTHHDPATTIEAGSQEPETPTTVTTWESYEELKTRFPEFMDPQP